VPQGYIREKKREGGGKPKTKAPIAAKPGGGRKRKLHSGGKEKGKGVKAAGGVFRTGPC